MCALIKATKFAPSRSTWPPFGDETVSRLRVPVGLICLGFGGSSIQQWLPSEGGFLWKRLELALNFLGPGGASAVLWHQVSHRLRRITALHEPCKCAHAICVLFRALCLSHPLVRQTNCLHSMPG